MLALLVLLPRLPLALLPLLTLTTLAALAPDTLALLAVALVDLAIARLGLAGQATAAITAGPLDHFELADALAAGPAVGLLNVSLAHLDQFLSAM